MVISKKEAIENTRKFEVEKPGEGNSSKEFAKSEHQFPKETSTMNHYLFALILSLVMLFTGCPNNQPLGNSANNPRTNASPGGTINLSESECKLLGGKVDTATVCTGTGKVCRTTTVESTGTQKTNELCINEKD